MAPLAVTLLLRDVTADNRGLALGRSKASGSRYFGRADGLGERREGAVLIRNFGRLWEKRFVQWGRPGGRGHLCGYLTPTSDEVDFRDQVGIYILSDQNRVPVYVGQAGGGKQRLFARLKQHTTDHLWNRWTYFTWFGFRRVNSGNNRLSEHDKPGKRFAARGGTLLNEIEAALLVALEPSLNKQGPRWKDVDEYFQVVDDDLRERSGSEVLREVVELKRQVALLATSRLRVRE